MLEEGVVNRRFLVGSKINKSRRKCCFLTSDLLLFVNVYVSYDELDAVVLAAIVLAASGLRVERVLVIISASGVMAVYDTFTEVQESVLDPQPENYFANRLPTDHAPLHIAHHD